MNALTRLFVFSILQISLLYGAESSGPEEAQFLSNIRQLTFEGKRSGEGYFSPDGKSLIFQSERDPSNPFYQIYTLDFESGDIHQVSPGLGKTTCAFFRPGSAEVLFASTHHDPEAKAKQDGELSFRATGKERRYSWDYDARMDIFSANRDGSNLKQLTSAIGYDAEASYSPDGKQIVFTSLRQAYPAEHLSVADRKRLETDPAYFGDIYIMNADGSDQRQLTHEPGYDGGPFFMPDGKRIVWRHFEENGVVADIHTMDTDGRYPKRLTDFKSMSWAPFPHPSGRYIIFTSNKLGFSNFELYLVDTAGKHDPVRVTFTDGFDGLPVFSPNGKQLCWTSKRGSDGKSQLFLADWSHDNALKALGQPALAVANLAPAPSQFSPEISAEDCRRHVTYLASDLLEGRQTGSDGSRLAADYIATQLEALRVKPGGEQSSYFEDFEFNAGVSLLTNENQLEIQGVTPTILSVEKDFRPLSFSSNGEAEGDVVFAGYGLFVAGKPGEGYDSYQGLNVSNKVVLVLRYVPENVDAKRRQELNRYAGLRYKAMLARERGAKALLVVTGPNSPSPGELVSLSSDGSLSGSGIIACSITTNVAGLLLSGSGKDLKTLQTALDTENPHAEAIAVTPSVHLKVATALNRIRKHDRNVLGIVPPSNASGRAAYVLVGAHYDHLGYGDSNSRETSKEKGQIHHGADDNASGVAALLELAGAFSTRTDLTNGVGICFAFWSGEEMGLLGSSYFAEHPTISLTNIIAYLNFDMVGRLRENKLTVQAVGSSSNWKRLIEKRNVAAGFNLALQDDPYLPTDVTSLYPKGIPSLNFFTGSHEDYHRPSDKAEKVNYDGMQRITRFSSKILEDLVESPARPDYLKVEQSQAGGSRDNLRVYLGTIPDYATEVAGVKLSGVRAGSPAEKGGLKGGDIIVEFAGQKIANIYDYTYALDAAKIGRPLEITIKREAQSLKLSVTPEARK